VNDLRVLRDRQEAASAALDRSSGQDPYASAALCVITANGGSYPTSAAKFYACLPLLLTGSESEGATPTFTTDTATTLYALNVGTAIPPVGSKLVIHSAGGRWVFRFDG
jgi:hypothetical protein